MGAGAEFAFTIPFPAHAGAAAAPPAPWTVAAGDMSIGHEAPRSSGSVVVPAVAERSAGAAPSSGAVDGSADVLIVEDSQLNRKFLGRHLGRNGFTYAQAEDGQVCARGRVRARVWCFGGIVVLISFCFCLM